MDSSQTCGGTRRPCLLHHHHHNHNPLFLFPHHHRLHHHYHLHFSPHCALHSHLLQPNSHGPHACPNPFPSLNQSNFQVPACGETYASDPLMIQEENEETFDEDEEDPVFVLTDEWREFFAKSEAKRKLAKKQARKKGKA